DRIEKIERRRVTHFVDCRGDPASAGDGFLARIAEGSICSDSDYRHREPGARPVVSRVGAECGSVERIGEASEIAALRERQEGPNMMPVKELQQLELGGKQVARGLRVCGAVKARSELLGIVVNVCGYCAVG